MDMIDKPIAPREKPFQLKREQSPEVTASIIEADNLVQATEARKKFNVSGKGLRVAVLDTGVRATHVDFEKRVKVQKNFTTDNNGDENDASDGDGHGTNVTGIIAANGIHVGIAPDVEIVAAKVLDNKGSGNFQMIEDALTWIRDENSTLAVSAICMSLGDGDNHMSDLIFSNDNIRRLIGELADQKVVTVVAAGNEYFVFNSQQGMSYPAIFRECISVGAVYDEFAGGFTYGSGAEVIESGPDRITPFSQRLHSSVNADSFTTIFGPGAPITSTGINSDQGVSVQHGTSQAAPVIAGIILLIQERVRNLTGTLPSVATVRELLRRGGVAIFDGDDEFDNVLHTHMTYRRASATGSLKSINSLITKEMLINKMEFKNLSL